MEPYYLRKWQDPILRKPCQPVEDFSQLDPLINSMYLILRQNMGFGLAAPQVGDSRQVFIARIDTHYEVFVNPVIQNSRGLIPFLEECLSFPGLIMPTLRKYSIDVKYQDRSGNKRERSFKGFNAIVLQHEIDHLKGKLIFHYFR